MLHLANKLSLLRILIAPLIVVLLYFEGPVICVLAAVAFLLASVTDFFDGYIARRENTVSNLGKFLDPLADKVLVCSTLIMLVYLGWAPAWVTIIIVCRELVVTGLRAMAVDEGIVLAADKYGKLKTVLQGFALVPLILHYEIFGIDPKPIGLVLLYATLIIAVYSGYNYLHGFFSKRLSKNKD